jgi:hypothetical protein
VQIAREQALENAMLAEESTLVAQQLVTLGEVGNARFHAQIEQSRAEMTTRRLMVRLGNFRKIGGIGKSVGLFTVMIMIALSLKIDTVQPAVAAQPVRAEMTHAGKTMSGVARSGLKPDQSGRAGSLMHSGLKLSDHLGE